MSKCLRYFAILHFFMGIVTNLPQIFRYDLNCTPFLSLLYNVPCMFKRLKPRLSAFSFVLRLGSTIPFMYENLFD